MLFLHVPDLLVPVMEHFGAVEALVDLLVWILGTNPLMLQPIPPLRKWLSAIGAWLWLLLLMNPSLMVLQGLL